MVGARLRRWHLRPSSVCNLIAAALPIGVFDGSFVHPRDRTLGLRARLICVPRYRRPALTSGDSAGFGVLHHRNRTFGVRGWRRRRSPVLALGDFGLKREDWTP